MNLLKDFKGISGRSPNRAAPNIARSPQRGYFTQAPQRMTKAMVNQIKDEEQARTYVNEIFESNSIEKMIGNGEAIKGVTYDMLQIARQYPLAYLAARESLQKAWDITPSPIAGLQQYDLEKPAKLLYPVMCPVRNLLPRTGGTGSATNWRGIISVDPNNVGIGVTTGSRAGVLTQYDFSFTLPYRTIGMENFVTFESQSATVGFEDILALAVLQTLQDLMIGEEFMILGGVGNPNEIVGSNFQLAQPTLTATLNTAGGSGWTNSTTYYAVVVPITLDGCSRVPFTSGSPNTTLATAVPTTVTRTNGDGSTTTFNAGFGQASSQKSVTTTATTNSVSLTCTAVPNAYGYLWAIGTTNGSTYIQAAVTNQNTITLTGPATSGNANLPAGLLSTNYSANVLLADGLWTQALGLLSAYVNPSSISTNAYYTGTATQVENSGSPFVGNFMSLNGNSFTADGASGLVELNNMLQWCFDFYKFSPHVIFIGSQVQSQINSSILNASGTPLVRFVSDMNSMQAKQGLVGGAVVTNYVNPFFDSGMGINIAVHPYLPPCSALLYTKALPYQLSNVSVLAQVKARRDYYAQEWPLTKRQYQYGVYSEELVECYFPPGFQVIANIGTPTYFSPGIRMPNQTVPSNTI